MSFFVRCFIISIVTTLLFLSGCTSVFANTPTSQPTESHSTLVTPNTNPDVPKNLHTTTQAVVIEVLSAFVCQLTGIDPINKTQSCLGIDQQSGKIGFVQNGGGLIGLTGNMIAMMYTPPFHTSDYVQYLAQNFGIAKPTYAANDSIGITGLLPLQNLWLKFRDIVYLMFVMLFVLVGLAIMLRIKIDPRTVMTIENRIPKLVVGLLLVSFSFAIVGVLIDLMWISTYLMSNTIIDTMTKKDPKFAVKTFKDDMDKNIYTPPPGFVNELYKRPQAVIHDKTAINTAGVFIMARDAANGLQTTISSVFAPKDWNDFWSSGKSLPTNCTGQWWECLGEVTVAFTDNIGLVLSQIFGWIMGWVVAILALLFLTIAILVALLKLWIVLLKAYVYILLHTVLAPFWIVLGLIPDSPVGFGKWIREIIANLAVFPVTIGMFLLGKVFMDSFGKGAGEGQFFVPPLIGNPNFQEGLGPLLGLAIILLTPQVVNIIKDLIKSPSFKYTSAIGQGLGVATGAPGSIMGSATHLGTSLHYMKDLGGLKNKIPGIRMMGHKKP